MLAVINDRHLLIAYGMSATRFLGVGRGQGPDFVVKKVSYGEEDTNI